MLRQGLFKGPLLIMLAGAVLPFAFSPFGMFPLAIFSLAIFFNFCLSDRPIQALKLGLFFGLAYFGVGVSWVQVSIHQFGLPVLAFSVLMTFLFVLVVAFLPAAMAYTAARIFSNKQRLQSFILLLGLPSLWVIFEWVRSWLFTGFPWLTIGYSQIDSPLAGYGPLLGVYGVSFLVAVSAGALILLWRQRRAGLFLALGVLLSIWIAGLILKNIEWTTPVAEKTTVAIVQGNVSQEKKWLPEQRQLTLDLYAQLSEPYWGEVDLIIWPETSLPAFAHELTGYLDKKQNHVEASQTDLLLGLPFAEGQTNNYYNSVISLKHTGNESLDIYHKRHLVPFGEYLPLKKWLDPILVFLQIPMSDFSVGNSEEALISTSKHQVGISICYEDVFGEEVISGLPKADFLINVSNDAWFGDSLAPHQHLEMARMRALETGRYLVRGTNTGISAIIDQRGKIIKQAPQFEVATLDGRVDVFSGATPYVRSGNIPLIMICFLFSVAISLSGRGEILSYDN